jgi:hypothetical protein
MERQFSRTMLTLALAALAGFAQIAPTSSLEGTVTDQSGSVVPNVSVTLRNLETGLERHAATSDLGKYIFNAVPVGLYSLQAEAQGFQSFRQSGIRLNVNTPATVDIRLTVGALTEQVSVTADAAMVNTQSGTLSQVVQQRYLVDLPLNGRNAATLIRMVPGTVTGVGTTTAGYANTSDTLAFSVNGTRGNEVNFRLDGATHMDNVTNLNAAYPNPDALQEFNVQTSNYSAQYGNFGGAVVNVVTRSGSNQLHGSMFHFLRNGAMNARNFFAAQSDNLKRNQYGGTIGGPVVRDRLFYFGSYQGTSIRNTTYTNQAFVPSAALRQGDFTSITRAIIDPLTNQAFPGNRIPAARILPIATNLLAKVPMSDAPNGLLRYARPDRSENHQFLAKGDFYWRNHTFSGSAFYVRYDDPGWDGGGTLLTARIGQLQTTRTFRLQDTWTAQANIVNTVNVSGLMLNSYNTRTSRFSLTDFGEVKFTQPAPETRQLELGVTGYSGWGSVTNTPPGQWIRRNVEVTDSLLWIKGKHTFNLGGEYSPFIMFDSDTRYQQSGNFSFSGQLTGNGISDLLLGRVATFQQSAGKFKQTRGHQISLYAEDTYRAARSLTLTLGIRWDPYLPYTDRLGQVAGYRAGNVSKRFLNAPPGAIFAGDPGFPDAGMQNDVNNFSPRLGFAWTPRASSRPFSVRGGYGIFFLRPFPRLYNNFVESAPFSPTIVLNGVDMIDPYGSAGVKNPFPPFAPVNLVPDAPFVFPMPYAYFKEDWTVGNIQSWNLTIEQQVAGDWLVRAAYVGNKGTHLQTFRERNAAVYRPGATVANTNARRPLAPYYASMRELIDAGNSVYHSAQFTVEKRLSKGFSILSFYTFSKSIDDESQNAQFTFSNPHPTDQRFNRGLSDFDVRHNFRASLVYELPGLATRHPLVRALVGGWSLSSILDWRSGFPFGLTSGRDNSFSGMNLDRADITGNPALPSDRPKDELIARYFDTSKVTFNAVGTFGNSPRNFLTAPGSFNIDSSLMKDFQLREHLRLQLRGEFFNLLNNVNLNQPGSNVSAPNNLGIITGAGSPRILQVGARLSF